MFHQSEVVGCEAQAFHDGFQSGLDLHGEFVRVSAEHHHAGPLLVTRAVLQDVVALVDHGVLLLGVRDHGQA